MLGKFHEISIETANIADSVSFYERLGFEKVGNYEFLVGSVRDPEFILRRGPRS